MYDHREFLPLPCFDDRDLKEAQREHRSSYWEFLSSKPHHENNGAGPDIAYGNGKRGQPLKVIIRGTDPKADMILDVLVRSACLSFAFVLLFLYILTFFPFPCGDH
jgi:hypothetical protein